MAELTEKGLAKLETLRDFWPPRGQGASAKTTQRYLLLKVEDDPEFHIDQHSMLRPDWNRLKDQGLIIDTTVEPTYVVEGTDKVLYRERENFIMDEPKCPDHPTASVLKASKVGTDRAVWICLQCGKQLGNAGRRDEPIREDFTVE